MIKVNVVTRNVSWLRYIKSPTNYIDRKIKKLNIKNKKFKKKVIFCTLLLSNNKEIKNLNRKFRKINKSTNVLSFPFNNKKIFQKEVKSKKEIYLGDIIINLNKVNSRNNLKIFKLEFDRLWIHGLVHLFGFDHKKEKDFKKMDKVEREYIKYVK